MSQPTEFWFWAICQIYEPFVMGGNVWQWRRFKLQGRPVKLTKKFNGHLHCREDKGQWTVYEATTGGLLGEGPTADDAISDARTNIRITPDLKKQIDGLGDTSGFREITSIEAFRRIDNAQRKEEQHASTP